MTHLSAELIAAHLDHRLDGPEREAVLIHLESCAECRHEIAAADRLIVAAPVVRRKVLVPSVALLVAAAAVLMVTRGAPNANRPRTDERTQRVVQPDLVPTIVALRPADDEVLTGRAVVLAWGADGRDAMYRITLQDGGGRVLWTSTTTDTTVTIPGEITLPEGQAYYWSVDALRPDGRSTTSKAHRFRR